MSWITSALDGPQALAARLVEQLLGQHGPVRVKKFLLSAGSSLNYDQSTEPLGAVEV